MKETYYNSETDDRLPIGLKITIVITILGLLLLTAYIGC